MAEDLIKSTMEEQAAGTEDGKLTDFGYYFLGQKIDTQIGELRQEMKSEINGLRSDIHGLRQEVKSEINGLRQEVKSEINGLRQEFANLQRWATNIFITMVVGFAGIVITILLT